MRKNKWGRSLLDKTNRTHRKVGQFKAKRQASLDISEYCKQPNSIYKMNYVFREFQVWSCLKYYNPIVYRIDTTIL